MEKGISQYWTPGLEQSFQRAMDGAIDFATRFSITSVGNALKYDHRSRASKKATEALQNTLASATDFDLQQLSRMQAWGLHGEGLITRDEAREKTIQILIRLTRQRAEACDRLCALAAVVEAGRIVRGGSVQ